MVVDVFLLLVYLGTGDARRLESGEMYWSNLKTCNWYASEITKRFGNYEYSGFIDPRDRVTAYCVPRRVNTDDVRIYDD